VDNLSFCFLFLLKDKVKDITNMWKRVGEENLAATMGKNSLSLIKKD